MIHLSRYRNGERVEETFGRFVLTRNSSLYIIGARTEDEATWELRDDSSVSGVGGASSGICMVTYNLKMSGDYIHRNHCYTTTVTTVSLLYIVICTVTVII